MKKRILTILFAIVFAISMSMFSFAVEMGQSDLSAYYQNAIKEMTESGLTMQQAQDIVKIERITKEMESTSQKVDIVEGKVQITNPANTKSKISKNDGDFLVNYLSKYTKVKFKSNKEKMKMLTDTMQKNPGRSIYRIQYDDGSWAEARSTTTRLDKISDDSVKVYGNIVYPNETLVQLKSIPYGNATYAHSYELIEADPIHYSKNMISVNYTTTTEPRVHINSAGSAQSSYGLITITNACKYINISDATIPDQPTKAEAENQVIYQFTGSGGVTLKGVFSISVNAGLSWTQYAIARLSVDAQWDYAAWYR